MKTYITNPVSGQSAIKVSDNIALIGLFKSFICFESELLLIRFELNWIYSAINANINGNDGDHDNAIAMIPHEDRKSVV